MLSKSSAKHQLANYKSCCQGIYSALALLKQCSLLRFSFTLQCCYNSVTSRFSGLHMAKFSVYLLIKTLSISLVKLYKSYAHCKQRPHHKHIRKTPHLLN